MARRGHRQPAGDGFAAHVVDGQHAKEHAAREVRFRLQQVPGAVPVSIPQRLVQCHRRASAVVRSLAVAMSMACCKTAAAG